ncbi:DUF1624 domain-containing protein [Actinotalea sp. M2MS4P-6]|uniref:DUF1624 domain-containing protein n=1 Tax=Actinotalea sp. M2MS4P-6 TaxID=2983762 RepID=UPI0021E380F2|nr:DUF1624 domain-containing protein [Actinotalea sp. M2MS4P-6]MCV2394014.1 DUF1624 domain-containing protein [Actinotalea sp. M2MS4P-6]
MPGAEGRIVGVDVARGLAVLGMAAAHVGDAGTWDEVTGALQLADGRSAATFATLAGVSIGLLSGGRSPRDLPVARARIATRAVLIGTLGVLLMALGTPVVVILPSYAVMFLLALPVLGASPRLLTGLAGVVLVVGAAVHEAVRDAAWALEWPVSILLGHYYPVVVWTAYLLAGLAVVRAGLLGRPARLAAIGLALALVGYGTGAVAAFVAGPVAGGPLDLTPHSSTVPEALGNLGVAFVVLAGSLAVSRRLPGVVAPLAATGALALTAYTGQVVAIAVLGRDVVYQPSNVVLAAFVVVTVAACWVWRSLWGRGPLERLIHGASVAVGESFATPARSEP